MLAASFECQVSTRSGYVDGSTPAAFHEVSHTDDLGVISDTDRFVVNDRHVCDSIWPLLLHEAGWIPRYNDVDIGRSIRDPLTLELGSSFKVLHDVYNGSSTNIEIEFGPGEYQARLEVSD